MEHSQKLPLPKGISPKIYRCLDVNWAEKLPVWGAHPITPIYMVSSLTTVDKMHDDDNKAPAEIAVTTLGHPDDWVSLSRQFRFLFLMPLFKWIKQH